MNVFKNKRVGSIFLCCFLAVVFWWSMGNSILCFFGDFLVLDDKADRADSAVVLCTGVDYYPRLIEAARLYSSGVVAKVVINGNRKTDVLRALEAKGFEPCCRWDENSIRILQLHGVPRKRIISVSAENAYDTVSEAEIVGKVLLEQGMKNIIVTTSKSHTRRAGYIWKHAYKNQLNITSAGASTDPFDPHGWWRDGRQIRWVLAEYGAWLYYGWKRISP